MRTQPLGKLRGAHFVPTLTVMSPLNRRPTLNLGAAIRRIREARNISLDTLALKTGLDKGNLSRIERGKQSVPTQRLEQIAAALGVAPIDVYVTADGGNVEEGPELGKGVPLISWVQAGSWQDVIDNLQPGQGERISTTWPARAHTFALRVRGDSMEPKFPDGSIIIVEPEISAQPGDFVIVRQNGDEATFKQLILDGSIYYLKPLNPRYPILKLDEDAAICGVVKRVEMDV